MTQEEATKSVMDFLLVKKKKKEKWLAIGREGNSSSNPMAKELIEGGHKELILVLAWAVH